jgi:hypothetical protein
MRLDRSTRPAAPTGADQASPLLVFLALLLLVLGLIRTSPVLGGQPGRAHSSRGWASAGLLATGWDERYLTLWRLNERQASNSAQSEPGLPPAGEVSGASYRPVPETLRPRSWERDPATIARQAAATVAEQLAAYPRLASYQERAQRAADRILYLQPLDFLIWAWFDRQPAQRDELLQLARREPEAAFSALDAQAVWPSPRAEVLLRSPAQYDVDDDRILVNLGGAAEPAAHRVLVHELWHATPDQRIRASVDGERFLTTGFWSARWDHRQEAWLPVEDARGLVFEPWLLGEAMTYRLERDGTRQQPETHERVRQAALFLDRVEALIGPEQLLRLYLHSDDDGFIAEVYAHRPLLAEYFNGEAPPDFHS